MTDSAPAAAPVPLACVRGGIPADERASHGALTRELFDRAVTQRSALADGYQFTFGVEWLEQIARFVRNERLCCPFLSFTIEIEPTAQTVSLRMCGPAGTRELLEAELRL
jgi:hypothetical protein